MPSDSTPSDANVPDDLSGLFELMRRQAVAPIENVERMQGMEGVEGVEGVDARRVPDPGRAYVSVAAATRETLRTFMLEFHKAIGVYGLPFAINPDPAGCVMCRQAMSVLQTSDGTYEASVPVEVLTGLDGQTRRVFDREFTGYRIHPSECPHVFVLSVPDTLYSLLDPVCAQVSVHDDTHLGRWLGEPEDLTPVLTVDEVSRAQFAAIGLDAAHASTRAALLTDISHVSAMSIPAPPDALALPAEVPTATVDLGYTDGDLTWTTDHPVRLRNATHNTYAANSKYSDTERTTLTATGKRLAFTHTRNPHDPDACTLEVDAHHDPHMTRRTRYLDGDTASFGPWWRPTPEETFTIELDATTPTPATVLDRLVTLPATVTLRHGDSVTGQVKDRSLHANPWTGDRYWSLTLVVTETPSDAHYLRILCPYVEGQHLRRDACVRLDSLTLTARIVP